MGEKMKQFAKKYGFKLIHSTLYYTQANNQVEATNKSLLLNIKNMVHDNCRKWHELLSKLFRAYRTS